MASFIKSFWPKSLKARRRLTLFLIITPVCLIAVTMALFALKDGVVYFYTPSQAIEADAPLNHNMRLGGLVKVGSVKRSNSGVVEFDISDKKNSLHITYQGDLPDLFREGQGVVCEGVLTSNTQFKASNVLAKHDEKYMPKEVTKALKEQGEWRPSTGGNAGLSQ